MTINNKIRAGIVIVGVLISGVFGSVTTLVLDNPSPPVESVSTTNIGGTPALTPVTPTSSLVSIPSQVIASFEGSGNDTTEGFTTEIGWYLNWSCDPYANGGAYPLPYLITVDAIQGLGLASTTTTVLHVLCDGSGAGNGTVYVPLTGTQYLSIQTGYPGQDGATTNLPLMPWNITIVEGPLP